MFTFAQAKPILCVIGAVLINLTLGTLYSIGNVMPYLASYMRNNGNPSVTTELGTWLTATFLLGQGFFMILGAYIERRFNNRIAAILGCIIHCSATYLTIWAINVNFTLVVAIYGLGSGFGCGSSYVSSIIAAQKWYPQRKGLLTGIIVAGFGFGGLIFTSLQTLYLNSNNQPPDSSGYFGPEVYNNVPNLFLYMGIIFTVAQSIGCALAFKPPPSPLESPTVDTNRNQNGTIISEDVLPDMRTFYSAFKYRIFYIIGLMMMLVAPGVTFVNSLGKKYGQAYINDDRFLATTVAVAAVANALGRLVWGWIMDKFSFSTCYTAKVILFATLIILFPFGFILSSKVLYVIWMLGLFFGFSGTFVLFPLFIEQVFGVRYHGIIYGVLYIALALASILTSLLIQVVISPNLGKVQSPEDNLLLRIGPCIVIGVSYIVSYIIYTLCVPYKRLENAINRKIELNLAMNKQTLFNRQDLFPPERGNLAEKTLVAINANSDGSDRANKGGAANNSPLNLQRSNSLGSIVKFGDASPNGRNKVHAFPKV